jgi:hypothetical protein
MNSSSVLCVFPDSYLPRSVCFSNVVSATFTGNTLDTIRNLLWNPYWLGSYKRISHGVSRFENISYITSVRYMFKLVRIASYVRYRYKTEWLNFLFQANISLISVDNWIKIPYG